jgi:hypothetical protein
MLVTMARVNTNNITLNSNMRIDLRLRTAIAVIAVCGVTVLWGFSIFQFSLLVANVGSSGDTVASKWAKAPGVASAALRTELQKAFDPNDWRAANRRREEFSSLVAIRPFSPADWLSLSRLELLTAQPRAQISAALMLSWVTGPNESYLTPERVTFGLSLWEVLPAELRNRVVMDLVSADTAQNQPYRAVLSTKPSAVQKELRIALLSAGLSPQEVERRLGY